MKDRVSMFSSFVLDLHKRSSNFSRAVLKLIDKHLEEGKSSISLNLTCIYAASPDRSSRWKTEERGVRGAFLFDQLMQDVRMHRELTECHMQCKTKRGICLLSVSSEECPHHYRNLLLQEKLRDQLIIPLCRDGNHFGNLSIFRGQEEPYFTQQDLLLLQETARCIASVFYLNNRTIANVNYYFRRFLYDMNIGAALIDRQLRILDSNASFQEYFRYVWQEGNLSGKIPVYTGDDEKVLTDPQKLIYHFGHRIITRPEKLRCDCMLYNFQISTKSLAFANPFGEVDTVYLIYVSQYKKISSEETMTLLSELTPREHELLMLLTEGNDNHQISEKLHISTHTVKSHLQNIYRKLDVTNKTELITRMYG